jgi:hypothetical protein
LIHKVEVGRRHSPDDSLDRATLERAVSELFRRKLLRATLRDKRKQPDE